MNDSTIPSRRPPTSDLASQVRIQGSLFEEAWYAEQSLDDLASRLPPPGDPRRPAQLRELTLRDLDLRLLHGLPIRVEDYLERFPELREAREVVLDLLQAEHERRRLAEPGLNVEDYRTRFPDYAEELARRLHHVPTVPGYEVLEELGRGGMGVVYKARQKGLNRLVALKMILAGCHAGATELARFRTEAEAAARLQHPNIVQVFEVGEHAGRAYLALEFCAGGSLADRLDGTPLPSAAAARLVETLARAVQHAHERGIIHRDLKPGNVLLQEEVARQGAKEEATVGSTFALLAPWRATLGTPKIADFGLAKKMDEPGQTLGGGVLGTPSYLAPEQAEAARGAVGQTTDVYALGAILYELLTGRPPFKGATAYDTLRHVLTEEPVSPRRLNSRVDRRLETVCLKCLRKEPAKRYGSAAALAGDLRRYLEGKPVLARPAGMLERCGRWATRQPLVAALAALLIVGAVGSAAAILSQWRQAVELARKESAARQRAEENLASAKQLLLELARVGQQPLEATADVQGKHLRAALLKAEAVSRQLLRAAGADLEVRAILAEVYEGLSGLQHHFGDEEQGFRSGQEAAAQWANLVRDEPDRASYHFRLAQALFRLAAGYHQRHDDARALELFRQAHARLLYVELHFPAERAVRAEAATYLFRLSQYLRRVARPAEALEAAEQSLRAFQAMVEADPDEPSHQVGLCEAWNHVAKGHWSFNHYDQTLHACRQALNVASRLHAKAPHEQEYRLLLDDRHVRLERILGVLRRHEEVLDSLREREKLWPKDAARLRDVARDLHELADEVADVGPLSPVERQRQDRYRAEAKRVAREAEAVAGRQ